MGHCELRQPDGEEEVEAKSRGGVGGSATTGAMQQPAGKQEADGRGGIQEANVRGGVSGQEAAERREDKRWRRHDVRRCNNQPEAPAEPPPPPPPPSYPAGMAALARTLATAAAATSPASSASSALAKSARPPLSSLTPLHCRRRHPRRMHGVPFWRRRRPLRSICGCSDRCSGWCDEKLTSVIRCVLSGVWNSLLAKAKVEGSF